MGHQRSDRLNNAQPHDYQYDSDYGNETNQLPHSSDNLPSTDNGSDLYPVIDDYAPSSSANESIITDDQRSLNELELRTMASCILGACKSEKWVMVILCGIPGSGKSTFSRTLLSASPEDDTWIHLNQDALGKRNAVVNAAREGLRKRQNIIIDRCNFDVKQRSTWVALAKEYGVEKVICVLLPNSLELETCIERATIRGDSDGVHDASTNWNAVCRSMKKEFVFPSFDEGIDCIYPCSTEDDVSEITNLLCRFILPQARE